MRVLLVLLIILLKDSVGYRSSRSSSISRSSSDRVSLTTLYDTNSNINTKQHRVIVAGASGYIGRSVVRELVTRGINCAAIVRSTELSSITNKFLQGSDIIECDVLDPLQTEKVLIEYQPTSAICCLASRSGVKRDAYAVDYQGGKNVLDALMVSFKLRSSNKNRPHYTLLSAFCCGKPLLEFQFAKLKLEENIKQNVDHVSHSIVRPTAFFKSLDGQIESVRKGNPILYFGDGLCSANAISEVDLAKFIVDCTLKPKEMDMLDETRDIGGPDVPPITKLQQGNMIYDALNIDEDKRSFVSIPLGIFDVLINTFTFFEKAFNIFKLDNITEKFSDAAELARIVKVSSSSSSSSLLLLISYHRYYYKYHIISTTHQSLWLQSIIVKSKYKVPFVLRIISKL
jgi:divinyl chlorophyllide a 8-vinyl-reductase